MCVHGVCVVCVCGVCVVCVVCVSCDLLAKANSASMTVNMEDTIYLLDAQ